MRVSPDRPVLLVVAAPKEARAVVRDLGGVDSFHASQRWEAVLVRPGIELLVTGVGKACAAGAVARVFDPIRHRAVINLGVAGALPAAAGVDVDGPGLCEVVLADQSVYGDEGIATPEGFHDVASMGFSPAPPGLEAMGLCIAADPGLLEMLRPFADRVGPIATVSTCSGTDSTAHQIVERTRAIAETMEGAAVGFTTRCVSSSGNHPACPFAEVRVISNTTGDRGDQRWDLTGALNRLSGLTLEIVAAPGVRAGCSENTP